MRPAFGLKRLTSRPRRWTQTERPVQRRFRPPLL